MSNTMRTADFVGRFKSVTQEIVCHSCGDEDEGGSSGMQMFERYQRFRGNCASVFSVEYVTPNRTYSSTTLQGFISQKNAVFTY